MRMLAVMVLLAGCVDVGADTEDHAIPDEVRSTHTGVLASPDCPASCLATTTLGPPATQSVTGMCTVTVAVEVACTPRAQRHAGIRVGVMVDESVWDIIETRYTCGDTVTGKFSVPCEALSIVGGATFDHPETAVDVSCLSPAQ